MGLEDVNLRRGILIQNLLAAAETTPDRAEKARIMEMVDRAMSSPWLAPAQIDAMIEATEGLTSLSQLGRPAELKNITREGFGVTLPPGVEREIGIWQRTYAPDVAAIQQLAGVEPGVPARGPEGTAELTQAIKSLTRSLQLVLRHGMVGGRVLVPAVEVPE